MCGDDLAFGEPSWLASLCSLKLARRPSTLPLPFLWANLTPLRPFPIVNKGQAGSLEICLCGGRWNSCGSGGRGGSCAQRRRCGAGWWRWGGVRRLPNKRSCLVGFCILRRSWLDDAGVLVRPRWVVVAVVGDSDACGRAGWAQCWNQRDGDAVQLESSLGWSGVLHAAALGSTHLGCLAGWTLQIAPSATSVRQRSSVRLCRGAALGRLASPRPQRSSGPFGRGPSVSRFCIGSRLS